MNPSTTSIDLNVGLPNIAVVSYAVQGDQQARVITANLHDGSDVWTPPAGAIGIIRFRTPLGTSGLYDTDEDGNTAVTWSGNVATLRIVQNAIAVAGCVPMQLEFYQGSQKLSAFSWMMIVEPSVLTDTEFMQTDYYNLLSKQINAVIGAAVYPPIINPTTRNWMLWDTETNSYVDSGYSSVGAKGDQGDQGVSITRIQRTSGTGEAGTNDTYTVYLSDGTTAGTFIVHNGSNGTNGLSIGRIEKTSGTGAAGTTDTYTVYLSNNTSVGTFTVYNGSDGEGSPGTQPPLMDGDQAAVGTAIKYAREDHVHPRDSTLKTRIDDLEEIVGDGSLSGFTATDLTGAANELKGSLNANESAIAIVANGNTHAAIASGQYVYVKNHSTLTEGLYKATAAIPLNGEISTTNVSNVSNGGLNDASFPIQLQRQDITNNYFDLTASYSSLQCFRVGSIYVFKIRISPTAEIPARTSDFNIATFNISPSLKLNNTYVIAPSQYGEQYAPLTLQINSSGTVVVANNHQTKSAAGFYVANFVLL